MCFSSGDRCCLILVRRKLPHPLVFQVSSGQLWKLCFLTTSHKKTASARAFTTGRKLISSILNCSYLVISIQSFVRKHGLFKLNLLNVVQFLSAIYAVEVVHVTGSLFALVQRRRGTSTVPILFSMENVAFLQLLSRGRSNSKPQIKPQSWQQWLGEK